MLHYRIHGDIIVVGDISRLNNSPFIAGRILLIAGTYYIALSSRTKPRLYMNFKKYVILGGLKSFQPQRKIGALANINK